MYIDCDFQVSPPTTGAFAEHDVRARVHELLLAIYPPGRHLERRRDRRYPYPRLIRLTPVPENGQALLEESIVVAGATLSERGLGFFHPQPLPYRHMICSFDAGDNRWLGLLIDLSWCRFTEMGWYESGGRFLQAVSAIPPTRCKPSSAETNAEK